MLKFTVDGQKLELLGDPFVVADSFDFLTGSFKFYSGYDWDLTEKHVFFQLGEATPYEVTLVDDQFIKTDHVNLTTGVWSIYVIGYDIDGATLVERITTNKVSLTAQISGVPDGEPFPPSIIPDVLIVKDQTEEQTFINGIPKLAEDRVISDDHHLVDKKHVADVVATVTADGFNHNDLANKQGGTTDEFYHMTQSQIAALHSHDNKTDLDSVSGVNTGDQDLSSYAKTVDLHSHSNKSDLDKVSGTNTGDQDLSSYAKTVDLHSHSNKSDLDKVSGTNTGDQDLSSYAKTVDLHSHDNKTDLDSVSGVNTGDQDLSSYAKTVDLHSHSNKSDLDKVSGTNTGDQDLSSYAKTVDLHSHSNKSDLDKVSGTNTGDQDLSSYAKTVDLHSHSNKSDLDKVSGTNTGDQDLSSYAKTVDLHSHSNKSDLDKVSGTNTGDQDLSSYAKSVDLHTHANKSALDFVSGTNTGDQTASSFNHNDLANKQGGTTNEYYHVTSAEKTVIQNTSGTNTGDQVLPTRDSLGLDIDDTVTFANLSGTNTGDQDVSGAISTHNTDAGAHAELFSIIRDSRVYTLRWDRVNAKGVRLNNAQGISTTITNFCHRETVNAAIDNPFDSIYPWNEINLCNISVDEYRALTPGSDIRDCAVSWLGDVDFAYGHESGVYVFRPEHFMRVIDDGPYRYIDISNKEIPGSVKQKARMEGRYFGVPYALTIDGVSKTCLIPKPGMPGRNIAMSTLHSYAKNWGASLENIYGYSDVNALMAVEYATLNSQDAVGNGVSDLYRQGGYLIKAAASNAAVVKILTEDASTYCIAGAVFDIGTTDGNFNVGSFIIASTALDTDPTYTNVTLTTDGTTPASVTVTTAHYWSVHGLCNAIDSAIGAASGYIGTNGRCNAYYRGQIAHANMFRYVLGAYRKSGNGGIWIANSEAEADAYDALNQGVHHDTGFTLPQGAGGAAVGGFIQTLVLHDGLLAPLCTAIGGGSINPVGDYCYAPSLATGDTVLVAGSRANNGTLCGRFSGYWDASAAYSLWSYGAVPVLKSP